MSFVRAKGAALACLASGSIGVGWLIGCGGSETSPSDGDDGSGPSTWNPELLDAQSGSKSDTGTSRQDGGFDASTQRFCTTLEPPTGIADFFCADFDGTNVRDGFTSWTVPGGGALTQTTELFYSPPAAFANVKNATLYWEKGGAKPFSEIDLKFRLHVDAAGALPNKPGNVTIVELGGTGVKTSIRYARGATVDGSANYVGYYLESGAVQKKIPVAIETDVWTGVHLVWAKNGVIELYYNDNPAYTTIGPSITSTTAWLTMGLVANGDAPQVAPHVFDDVVVAVKRN